MANGKQATAKRMKMAERAQQQMDIHFPNAPRVFLWHRKTNDGYTVSALLTPPLTMAEAMR